MNITRCLSGLVSIGAALWLLAGAQGCGPQISCGNCDCEYDGCDTTSDTDTTTSDTETTTSTETTTTSSTSIPDEPPSPEGVCQKVCACQPQACSGAGGIQACIESFEEAIIVSQANGCADEFNVAFTCFDEKFMCVSGEPEVEECEPLIEQLNACMDGPPPGPTACDEHIQKILTKYVACDIEVGEIDPVECTPDVLEQLACMSVCIQEAPCVVFNGEPTEEQSQEFAGCVSDCQ